MYAFFGSNLVYDQLVFLVKYTTCKTVVSNAETRLWTDVHNLSSYSAIHNTTNINHIYETEVRSCTLQTKPLCGQVEQPDSEYLSIWWTMSHHPLVSPAWTIVDHRTCAGISSRWICVCLYARTNSITMQQLIFNSVATKLIPTGVLNVMEDIRRVTWWHKRLE